MSTPNKDQFAAPTRRKKTAPVKTEKVRMTDDIREYDRKLVEAWKSTQRSMAELSFIIEEGMKQNVYLAFGFESAEEYLMNRFGCELRAAQQYTGTIRSLEKVGLKSKDLGTLGPTATREVATFIRRANPKKDEVLGLIGKIEKEQMTTDAIQQHVRKELKKRRIASVGRGSDPDEPVRHRVSWMMTDEQEKAIKSMLADMSKAIGNNDEAQLIELGLANSAAAIAADPGEASGQAERLLEGALESMNQVCSSVGTLMANGNKTSERQAMKLSAGLQKLSTATMFSVANFLSDPGTFDRQDLLKHLSSGDRNNMPAVIDQAKLIIEAVSEIVGLDKPVIKDFISKMDSLKK